MYPSSTTPHSNDGNGNGTLHLSRNRYSSSQDLCNAPLRQSHSYSDLSGYASPHSPPPPTPPLAAATGAQGRQGSMEHSHPADANSSLNKAHAYISKLERQLEEANRRMHGLEQELEEERQARLALEQGVSSVESGRKGKLEQWEREKVEDFITAVRQRKIKVAKGELARELRVYVNGDRSQEFYEKLVSRRGLNKEMNHLLLPRKKRPINESSSVEKTSTDTSKPATRPPSKRKRTPTPKGDFRQDINEPDESSRLSAAESTDTAIADARTNGQEPAIESFTALNAGSRQSSTGSAFSHQKPVYQSNPPMMLPYQQHAPYNNTMAGVDATTPEGYASHLQTPYNPPRFAYGSDPQFYFNAKSNSGLANAFSSMSSMRNWSYESLENLANAAECASRGSQD